MNRRPPRSTVTDPPFPYRTPFRSHRCVRLFRPCFKLLACRASFGVAGLLRKPEDDEFGGFHGSAADETDEPARVDVGLGRRLAVAPDEERFVLGQAGQRAGAPAATQEGRDVAADGRARGLVLRLEDAPPGSLLPRFPSYEDTHPPRNLTPF